MNNELNQNNNPMPTMTPAPVMPTMEPTMTPVPVMPTIEPTMTPVPVMPTIEPTMTPAPVMPTMEPTMTPVPVMPTMEPTMTPVPVMPTIEPTMTPVPVMPTIEPTMTPVPVIPTIEPTMTPVPVMPTMEPTIEPTIEKQNEDNPYELKQVKVTKKRNLKLPIIIGIIILLIVIIGFITFKLLNSPQKIFANNIKLATQKIVNNIKDKEINNTLNDINLSIKTDDENLKEYENYTYGIKGGVNTEEKKLEGKVYILDENKNEYSYTGYILNSIIYSKFSTFDKLIYQEAEENDIKNILDSFKNSKTNDIKYLINFVSKSLINNLNKNKLSQKIEKISVNDKKISAIKNTYKLDAKEKQRLIEKIIKDIINDKEALKTVEKLTGINKENLESIIKDDTENYSANIETQIETQYINIYTNLFGKTVGLDTKNEKEIQASYYKNKSNFEIKINEYGSILQISGIKRNKLEITVKQDDNVLAEATINKNTKDEKDIDYNLKNYKIKGNINYKNKLNNKKQIYNITANSKTNKYELNITVEKEENAKIANINAEEAIQISEEEFEKIYLDFIKSLEKTPISLDSLIPTNSYTDSKTSKAINSTYNVIDAVRLAYTQNQVSDTPVNSDIITVTFGSGVPTIGNTEVTISGETPTSGSVEINTQSGSFEAKDLVFNGYVCNTVNHKTECTSISE